MVTSYVNFLQPFRGDFLKAKEIHVEVVSVINSFKKIFDDGGFKKYIDLCYYIKCFAAIRQDEIG